MFGLLSATLAADALEWGKVLAETGFSLCCALALGNVLLAFAIVPAPQGASAAAGYGTRSSERWLVRGACLALVMALVFSCCWWPLITQQMSGAASLYEVCGVMGVVLNQTTFGSVLKFYWLLMVLGLLLLLANRGPLRRLACKELAITALVVVAMLPMMTPLAGHGESVPPGYLIPMVLHVLAASAWIGALPGLVLVCRRQPEQARVILMRFSWLGMACVATLALSGLLQSMGLLNSWSGLADTRYGVLIALKLVLFGVLLMLAAVNRWYWIPRIHHSVQGLSWTVAIEVGAGLLVFVIATLLAQQSPPGMMGMMDHG